MLSSDKDVIESFILLNSSTNANFISFAEASLIKENALNKVWIIIIE